MHNIILAISEDRDFIRNGGVKPTEEELVKLNSDVFDWIYELNDIMDYLEQHASSIAKYINIRRNYYFKDEDITASAEGNKITIRNFDESLIGIFTSKIIHAYKTMAQRIGTNRTINTSNIVKHNYINDLLGLYIYDLDNNKLSMIDKYIVNLFTEKYQSFSIYVIGAYNYHG